MGADFDWRAAVRGVAPVLGTALGGPLAGAAVAALSNAILGGSSGDAAKDEERLAGVIAQRGMDPQTVQQVLEAENALRVQLRELQVEETRIAAETERAYIADTQQAREAHAQSAGVMRLGYAINALSYLLIGLVLIGCYRVLAGDASTITPELAMAVGTVAGSVVQWVMGNAAQANGFFFGSSPTSRANASKMADAIANAAKRP